MNQVFYGLIAFFVVFAVFLIYHASREGTSPVFLPSELAAEEPGQSFTRVRVAGRVAELPIEYSLQPIELKFSIKDNNDEERFASVPVVYQGLMPDMFSVGRDVIIDGAFSDGTVFAKTLMTQCPSKYEAPDLSEQESYSASYGGKVSTQ